MKTIQINLYTFSELSKESQQKVIQNFRDTTDYFNDNEAINSLKRFAEHFGSELKDYSIDFFNNSHSSVKFSEVEEIKENELKELVLSMGEFNPETLRGLGECKFTGVCFDEDAADGARISFFNGERDVNKLLQAGFKTWLKAVHSDTEYLISDKGITETIEANDYTFEEDGTLRNT